MKHGEIDSPGAKTNTPIGKAPTGRQDQGNNIDVTNYAKVNTGKAGKKANIDSVFTCDLVKKIPTGEKTGGL